MKSILRFWVPVIAWMAAIFLLSSREKVALTDSYTVSFLLFKTLHLIEYALLYLLSFRALWNTGMKRNKAIVWAFLLTLLYAATDEIHQRYVPTREGKVRDVIIDGLGGGLGWITLIHILPKAPKKLKTLAGNCQLL